MLTSQHVERLMASYPADWNDFRTGKSQSSLAKLGFYFSRGSGSSDSDVICVLCGEKISCQHLSQCQVVSCPTTTSDSHCQCQPDPMPLQAGAAVSDEVDHFRLAGIQEENMLDLCPECKQPRVQKVKCGLCSNILCCCKCFFSSGPRKDQNLTIEMHKEGGLPVMNLPSIRNIEAVSPCCSWCETPSLVD